MATPLFWEEVNESLQLKDFTIDTIPNRIKGTGVRLWITDWWIMDQPFGSIVVPKTKKTNN
ncbi:hypothetical protein KEH51_24475 [[Brevibacterium] frigoritolerans]|uniref:Uncharacterized protein n=1 Tax=Peribacillus frigoritolerans TaxID=450367 RepID=A0A941FM07_9BACI|nr:hypothetical protein [Peribacillus frigoritolerans]